MRKERLIMRLVALAVTLLTITTAALGGPR